MLKVLLVDDEVLTIKMLQNIINWQTYGLEIVATASDGLEAYEKFLLNQPDIIITDINMPNLNGIDFIKKVRNINSKVEFILVSAHTDFQYIKKAMKLGCSDYIVKPIDEYELSNSIKKIVSKISGEKATHELVEKSKLQIKQNMLFSYMKTGANVDGIKKITKELPISFDQYHLINISLNNDTINEYEGVAYLINTQMNYAVKKFKDILSEYGNHILFDYDGQFWFILIADANVGKILEFSQRVIAFIKEEFSIQTSICFSRQANVLEELPGMYRKILLLNRYSFYHSNEAILGYEYNCGEQEFDKINMLAETKNASILINQLNTRGAIEKLIEVLTMSQDIGPDCLYLVYEFCYEIILSIKKILTANNIENEIAKEVLKLSYEDLTNYLSMIDLEGFMKAAINSISNTMVTGLEIKYSKSVEEGIRLLKDQYNKNISLDEICDEIAVSKNYFCYLFKREVGQSIWGYLTGLRISKAKELLEGTDMMSYEIAFQIGYDNPSYFSKVFKKHEKMTPNEYREKVR